jgi:tRNA-modifying protein YgfZ
MYPLHSLAPIRFSGADARSFLQGQLSNDLTALTLERSLLASCNSAQGRVQAVLRLIQRDDAIVALLPRAMVERTLARLRKYVLRTKVIIEDASDSLQILWMERIDLENKGWPIPAALGGHLLKDGTSVLRWPDSQDERFLALLPGVNTMASHGTNEDWRLADIRAGLPQVVPETHESFVAQMLNLDALNGISFNKGCYTGQEIIARAHFRGTVKRRMFRFQAQAETPNPGTRILANKQHAGEVVLAVPTAFGCELLAVINLAQRDSVLTLENSIAPLELLTLPYLLPSEE